MTATLTSISCSRSEDIMCNPVSLPVLVSNSHYLEHKLQRGYDWVIAISLFH